MKFMNFSRLFILFFLSVICVNIIAKTDTGVGLGHKKKFSLQDQIRRVKEILQEPKQVLSNLETSHDTNKNDKGNEKSGENETEGHSEHSAPEQSFTVEYELIFTVVFILYI